MTSSLWKFLNSLFRVRTLHAVLAALLFSAAPALSAAGVPVERIDRFDVSARLDSDAGLTVTENLTLNAAGVHIVHGLIRAIPVRYRDSSGRAVTVGLEVFSTKLDGKNIPWKESREGRDVFIRIGSADKVLSAGQHTLELTYRITKQIGFFSDHDELYWNVTGSEWEFPIMKTTFRLQLPGKDWGEGVQRIAWYTGVQGSTDTSRARKNPDGSVTASRLDPGEGLTVVYGWPKGLVTPPALSTSEKISNAAFQYAETVCAALNWIGAAVGACLLLRAFLRTSSHSETVIPLFHAPDGLSPSLARWAVVDQKDIISLTAEIIALAEKGYLKILGNKNEGYRLKMTSAVPDEPEPMAAGILTALFLAAKTDELPLKKYKYRYIEAAMSWVKKLVNRRSKQLTEGNGSPLALSFAPLFTGSAAALIFAWIADADSAVVSYNILTVFLSLTALLASFKRRRRRKTPFRKFLSIYGPVLPLFVIMGALGAFSLGLKYTLPGILLTLAGLPLRNRLTRWTAEGRKVLAQAYGLEMFINAAEKDRLEMLSAPDDTPELFEELLPYAVALGCAKTWADRFEKVLAAASYHPQWCDMNADMPFYSRDFISGLNSLSRGFSSTLSAAPGSSSGFDGGSSGGGGGGGGGRGW
ncbi:MAG: DUF2207 domain-containing protein [Pyramidobacter sp.]